jgi:hypothetical protein
MSKFVESLPPIFKESIGSYLKAVRPQYDRKRGRFLIREREVQAYFFAELLRKGIPARLEGRYKGSRGKFYDVLIERKRAPKIFVEVEWNAALTDCFGKQTFLDLEKLCKITRIGNIGLFLAVNISNKYRKFPKRPANSQKRAPIFDNLKIWYWRYPYIKGEGPFNVTVLTCYGRRTEAGWR